MGRPSFRSELTRLNNLHSQSSINVVRVGVALVVPIISLACPGGNYLTYLSAVVTADLPKNVLVEMIATCEVILP